VFSSKVSDYNGYRISVESYKAPISFLIFIDDFGNVINSAVFKFADISKLTSKANCNADCEVIP